VKSRPEIIKPNLAELGELLGYRPTTQKEVHAAARRLYDEYGSHVIITLGDQGAIAVFGEHAYVIHPVSVPVVSAAGAGDGVLAGMALVYLRGETYEYGLQHGFALAGAVLQTLSTADFRVEDYERLLPQIRIERI
jgi:fructose-1-phosphate kinase PfkB-like protein